MIWLPTEPEKEALPIFLLKSTLFQPLIADPRCPHFSAVYQHLSIRAGIQFQNPVFFSRKMMLLLEYYEGQSPNGHFYERDIEFTELGLHFFLE